LTYIEINLEENKGKKNAYQYNENIKNKIKDTFLNPEDESKKKLDSF
jgi:hypothetical protein